jgi:broad specificity phosphatase PhoE
VKLRKARYLRGVGFWEVTGWYNSAMRIYLVRHGQTTGDIEDRYGGDYEDHLTEEGQRQSQKLAEKLLGKGIEIVYCSPRIRAVETALSVTDKIEVPMEIVEEIRERNHYGILTGLKKEEAKDKYPNMVELLKDTKKTVEGGEDYEGFKKRIIDSWNKLLGVEKGTIMILSHGGPIRIIFREILRKGEIEIGDCAYAVLDTKGDEIKIIEMDGISFK